ncbi:DNA-deoxyinosine glycosylase [Gynuella sunshinyii]|uniref:G:T/U mismatch-specific DNA glycosylase n=1 Tax=Gynuella sunshinyii YC6258 TaxID=1445510 RepID=A0A0C5VBZ0_9GAMM|nr:DNA-deoxyinosine glycosylase [Gynuella sunshinyii]AJQ96865.1 g:T/U mismatch-specific DNA glycosylase [Gynuella sunshinyii YC6258]
MNLKQSFPPVIAENSEILVLGSMPGEASLRQQQYYGHPQNLFWQILLESEGYETNTLDYADRLTLLKSKKVALWDVLEYCERRGSLDSSIVAKSEQANDLVTLLRQYKNIRKICFNGKKSYQSFNRHVFRNNTEFFHTYELVTLPSTSPANASIPRTIKYQQWVTEVWNPPRV